MFTGDGPLSCEARNGDHRTAATRTAPARLAVRRAAGGPAPVGRYPRHAPPGDRAGVRRQVRAHPFRGRRGLLPVLVFHAGARPTGPAMAGRGRPSRGHRPETRRTARGHPMSAAEPKRALTDIPEAADISRLLGEVTGVASPPSPPRG